MYDQPLVLQIDGGINHGNSGGPMVTEDGKLVGIAVAKFRGADNIGFAIPKKSLSESIKGRAVSIQKKPTVRDAKGQSYSLQVDLMDPSQNIESASVVTFASANQVHKAPKADGNWEQATNDIIVSTDLSINSTSASGKITCPDDTSDWMFQIRIKRKDGSSWFSPPGSVEKDSSDAPSPSGTKKPTKPKGNDTPAPLEGQLQVVSLPDAMADFAMNPSTGEIAAVDPMANSAILLRDVTDPQDAPRVNVGTTPISIEYKRFGDKEVFALVCTQDSHMYILDTKEFKLLKKIPIKSAGVSSVTASQNPEDPFVYYCFGGGHDAVAGAVDLRKMVDCGIAFDHAMDCAISADGLVAYRRGPWSPSGFESLSLKTTFADSSPKFERLFYDHNSTAQYYPDPRGEFTASGSAIYSKDLSKKVASMNFIPMGFFRDRPVVFGLREKTLRVASYNTFSDIGVSLNLPIDPQNLGSIPRGGKSDADFKQVGYKLKLMADEDRSRIIVGVGNKLFVVPLSDLQIEDEPFMTLDIGSTDLKVGITESINIAPRDPRVSMQFGDLPDGAKQTDKGLEWKPSDEHVGTTKVHVTLSHGDTQRVVETNFKVTQPFISSPIDVGNFIVDEKSAQIIVWSSSGIDEYGRPITNQTGSNNPIPRIAVIPLKRGGEVQTISHLDPIQQVVASGSRLAVLLATDKTRVEVYEGPTFKRIKTLVSATPLVKISIAKDQLTLQSESGSDIYQMSSLKRLRTVDGGGANGSRGNATSLKDGILANELLVDTNSNEPILLISPGSIPSLGGAEQRLFSGSFLRRDGTDLQRANSNDRNSTSIVSGPIAVPNRSVKVSLENSVSSYQPPGSVHTNHSKQTVSLRLDDAGSSLLDRIRIVEDVFANQGRPVLPTMQVLNDDVFVAFGKRIFRWRIKSPPDKSNDKNTESGEFYIVPHQSQFVLKNGRNSLKHIIRGGKQPYDFSLLSPFDGLTFDEKTGTLNVDQNALMQAALPVLTRYTSGANDLTAVGLRLQAAAAGPTEFINTRLRLKVNGFPVAIPIHFKVIDELGQVAELQYFVIMDIPFQEARKMVKQSLN
jgi:hypothetical protein